jgi:hypothetical protein
MPQITPTILFKLFACWFSIASAILTYACYTTFQGYVLEKESRYFTPVASTSTTRIGESLATVTTGGKISHTYYNPCIVFTVNQQTPPINACKRKKQVIKHRIEKAEAQQLLKTQFSINNAFPIYVSPNNTAAFLDAYTEQGEQATLFDFIIALVVTIVLSIVSIFLWVYNPEKHKPITTIKKRKKR